MKTISIKQPWAFLICSGIKPIENRTWPTNYKGRVLVHASAKRCDINKIFTNEQWAEMGEENRIECAFPDSPTSAIIGSVEIVDCLINDESIWAEKTEKEPIIYNWVLANPVLFAKPILNVKGKLSLWDYPMTEEEYLNLEKIGNPLKI